MKPVKLSDFYINHSRARSLAEQSWGSGGTNAYKTNRKGVYYFACSSHGGYIVNPKMLAEEEKHLINKYMTPEKIMLAVQNQEGVDYVLGYQHPCAPRQKIIKYQPALGEFRWVEYEFYEFEEDCAWAILEYYTDVQTQFPGTERDPQEARASVVSIFSRYYSNKSEQAS